MPGPDALPTKMSTSALSPTVVPSKWPRTAADGTGLTMLSASLSDKPSPGPVGVMVAGPGVPADPDRRAHVGEQPASPLGGRKRSPHRAVVPDDPGMIAELEFPGEDGEIGLVVSFLDQREQAWHQGGQERLWSSVIR